MRFAHPLRESQNCVMEPYHVSATLWQSSVPLMAVIYSLRKCQISSAGNAFNANSLKAHRWQVQNGGLT